MQQDSKEKIAHWLTTAEKPIVFTGAGVSTESGIPDFRSPGGVWSKYKTVYFDEFLQSADARREYWRQKSIIHRDLAVAIPNIGHHVIADWEARGFIHGVITQNIDGLHQIAGNKNVLELHGSARKVSCLDCNTYYDAEPMVLQFRQTNQVPRCTKCTEGRLKHATISFGQELPAQILNMAVDWCEKSRLLLAIGSSLVVSPAADLPLLTTRYGGQLVIINRDTTPLDKVADLVIHETIGETLSVVNGCLKKTLST